MMELQTSLGAVIMKSKAIVCAVTIAALGFGSVAQAQEWQGHRGHQGHGQAQPSQTPQRQWQGHQGGHWGQPSQVYPQQQHQRGYYAPQYSQRHYAPQYQQRDYSRHYYAPQYQARAYGPHYYRGGYLPYEYRAHRYWVNDWRARHLAAPPYGYQWVETDAGDVVLIALATGLIANILLNQ
jgi:Ni/Co efflux regulator RcnB